MASEIIGRIYRFAAGNLNDLCFHSALSAGDHEPVFGIGKENFAAFSAQLGSDNGLIYLCDLTFQFTKSYRP